MFAPHSDFSPRLTLYPYTFQGFARIQMDCGQYSHDTGLYLSFGSVRGVTYYLRGGVI
jgi:hypothetical protein